MDSVRCRPQARSPWLRIACLGAPGGARPSPPAQHFRKVGRGAEPRGVTGQWPGPAATAVLAVTWELYGAVQEAPELLAVEAF